MASMRATMLAQKWPEAEVGSNVERRDRGQARRRW